MQGDSGERKRQYDREDDEFRKFSSALKLCVAYASNVGGTGTLIGCGPNIVMKGMADSYVFTCCAHFWNWNYLAFEMSVLLMNSLTISVGRWSAFSHIS
jgi:solute carrier family 13 (sodium-dependent dicarboxylate transporter), member 2/3/5